MDLTHVNTMAATAFPRFTEFPLEIQMRIWENAIDDVCANKPKDFNLMDEAYYYFNTRRDFHGWCGLVMSHTRQRWIGPRTGAVTYWPKAWYRSGYAKLMNSCCMARMVALRKMMREGSKPKFYDNDREVVLFKRIAREMIEDLEKRLEA